MQAERKVDQTNEPIEDPLTLKKSMAPETPVDEGWRRSHQAVWLIVVVLVAVAALYVSFGARPKAAPRIAADRFLAGVESQKYDGLYGTIAERWKQEQSKEEFVRYFQEIEKSIGPLQSTQFVQLIREKGLKNEEAEVAYEGTFAHGGFSFTISLTNASGHWKPLGFRLDSATPPQLPLHADSLRLSGYPRAE